MDVVIIGGGFCGTFAARCIERKCNINTTLIDKKNYFEYSPGLHKAITNPSYLDFFQVPYISILKHTTIIKDTITAVTPEKVSTENHTFNYDYLVISTGIDYPIFMDNKKDVHVLKHGEDALTIAEKIKEAESILIIGGGLIGTEIAGELVKKTLKKNIIMVHKGNRLLNRTKEKASLYTQRFLEKNDTTIIFNDTVTGHKDDVFTTKNGKKIRADLAIWCGGIKANPEFMIDFPKDCFSDKNALNVNTHLQLIGFPNIFVGGDINSVKEEKTARKAKIHGLFIGRNLIRINENKALKKYYAKKTFQVISLGDSSGIIQHNNFVYSGPIIPGIFKFGAGLLTRCQMF